MQADLNVSLTSINLLWNTADLLAKRSVHSLNEKGSGGQEALPYGNSANSASNLLDREKFEELLRFLFQSIQVSLLCSRYDCYCQGLPLYCQSSVNRPTQYKIYQHLDSTRIQAVKKARNTVAKGYRVVLLISLAL